MTSHPTDGRINVLFVHPSPDLYGSDRVFERSVAAACVPGANVHVVLPEPGPLSEYLTSPQITVHYIKSPVLRKNILTIAGARTFGAGLVASTKAGLALIKSAGINTIYVNTVTLPWWLVLGRLGRCRVLCHVHEAEHNAPAYVRLLINTPIRLAHDVLINSHNARLSLRTGAPKHADRAVMLANPVHGKYSAPRSRLEGTTHIGYVGRLSERKGVHVAIAAMAKLRKQGHDVKLHVIGAVYPGYEWYEQRLRDLVASLGISDAVHFHGFTPDPGAILKSCDLAVVPSSDDEAFGNTVPEAILAGRPVSVAAHFGLLEAGRGYQNVAWHQPGDADDLARSFVELMKSWPERVAAAADDRDLAQARHSDQRYGRSVRRALQVGLEPNTQPQTPGPVPKVVVAALTYQRNDLLPQLIPDLVAQVKSVPGGARVLIVDNNPEPVAKKIAEDLLGDAGWYVHHPRPGIATARNRAIAEAEQAGADAVVFIDDDETPAPHWLAHLVHTYRVDAPAGVVGPVLPEFSSPPPQWLVESGLFNTARHITGQLVPMAATNNLLLDLKTLAKHNLLFKDKFSFSGGSDSRLTWELVRAGESLMWNDDAAVVDHIPAGRMTFTWLVRRAYRLASCLPRVEADLNPDTVRHKAALVAKYSVHGSARIAVGTARAIWGTAARSSRHQVRGARTAIRGVGMLMGAVGHTYNEYKRPYGQVPRQQKRAPRKLVHG